MRDTILDELTGYCVCISHRDDDVLYVSEGDAFIGESTSFGFPLYATWVMRFPGNTNK